jgi:hypothetical protein
VLRLAYLDHTEGKKVPNDATPLIAVAMPSACHWLLRVMQFEIVKFAARRRIRMTVGVMPGYAETATASIPKLLEVIG